MSVVIRLARIGKRGIPIYRVVVIDRKSKRNGIPLEVVGNYTPKSSSPLVINEKRIAHWQNLGASVSSSLAKLLASA